MMPANGEMTSTLRSVSKVVAKRSVWPVYDTFWIPLGVSDSFAPEVNDTRDCYQDIAALAVALFTRVCEK